MGVNIRRRLTRRLLALRPTYSCGHQFVARYTEGFSHFVTSMTAPVASGWSESPCEPFTHWNAPPFTAHTHSGHSHRSFALRKFLKTLGSPRGASWRQICTTFFGGSKAAADDPETAVEDAGVAASGTRF